MKIKEKKTKLLYDNFQFYEFTALNNLVKKYYAEGYDFCRKIGGSFWEFKKKQSTEETSAQNLFSNNDWNEHEKSNFVSAIPIKGTIILVSICFTYSLVTLFLNLWMVLQSPSNTDWLCLGLYTALLINFVIYFVGDLYDLSCGKIKSINGSWYFTDRSKLKKVLFVSGDIIKYCILFGSIVFSIWLFFIKRDIIMSLEILKLWIIFFMTGFIWSLRRQKTYIFLLLLEIALATLKFG